MKGKTIALASALSVVVLFLGFVLWSSYQEMQEGARQTEENFDGAREKLEEFERLMDE